MNRQKTHIIWLLSLLVFSVFISGAAFAQTAAEPSDEDRTKAGEYYMEGERLFREELYAAAIENFKKAHAIIPAHQALYNIARSYEKLGDGQNCVDFYNQYVDFYNTNEGSDPRDIRDIRVSIQKCQLGLKPEVSINSEPIGADVYFNNRDKIYGQTPLKTNLDPGVYKLILDKPNFQPFETTFEVRAGEPTKLYFKLEKFTRSGTIHIKSNIRGASVFVDGRTIGLTPYDEPIILPEGQHQLTVKKDLYEDHVEEFEIKAGEELTLETEQYLRDTPVTAKTSIGWVMVGIGAIGVAGAAALGPCYIDGNCGIGDSDHPGLYKGTSELETWKTVQQAGYWGGGAMVGIGLALILWDALDSNVVLDGDKLSNFPSILPYFAETPDGKGAVGGGIIRF